jgi:hypothetical protein
MVSSENELLNRVISDIITRNAVQDFDRRRRWDELVGTLLTYRPATTAGLQIKAELVQSCQHAPERQPGGRSALSA